MQNNPEGEMERLSKAIVEAILASGDVKKALEKIQSADSSAAKSLMVFMLRLDSLAEFKEQAESEAAELAEFFDEEELAKPKRRRLRKKGDKITLPDIIDGKVITSNERKFLDFLSDAFDQDTWLKKNGLKLD